MKLALLWNLKKILSTITFRVPIFSMGFFSFFEDEKTCLGFFPINNHRCTQNCTQNIHLSLERPVSDTLFAIAVSKQHRNSITTFLLFTQLNRLVWVNFWKRNHSLWLTTIRRKNYSLNSSTTNLLTTQNVSPKQFSSVSFTQAILKDFNLPFRF